MASKTFSPGALLVATWSGPQSGIHLLSSHTSQRVALFLKVEACLTSRGHAGRLEKARTSATSVTACWRHSLYDPVFTGGEVIFGRVDEGNSEVEHQIEDEWTHILGQEDLKK